MDEYILDICKNTDEWNHFTKNYDGMVTIAHNPSLKTILEKSFGFNTQNVVIKKDDKIVGTMPISRVRGRLVSIPHFSYGDILFNGSNNEKQIIRKKIINDNFEIRSFEAFSDYFNDSKLMFYFDLKENEEEQLKSWSSKLRQKIRKGLKNNVKVKEGKEELLPAFYKIYSKNMKDLGSPVLSYKFFKNILRFYKYGEAKVFLAYQENKNLAAGITLSYSGFIEICWSSTLKEHINTKANMVLYWEMIKDAINSNNKYFSFGRSSKDDYIVKFKRQWCDKEQQLYFNYSHPKKINIRDLTFLAKLWSKLPLFLTNALGPYFSKRIY
jgi:hypothetical protein